MSQKPGILVKSSNKSIEVGKGVGVYTDIFQIYNGITYTLSFKCLNLNNTTEFNYLRLFTSNNVQTLDSAKLDNKTGLVVGDKEEYFVKLTFKSTLEGKARLLIGREYVEGDLIDTPLFFIREVQLQKGSYATEFDNNSDLISNFKKLESQFNILNTDINMKVSRKEFDSKYNPILDEVSSIDIKSGKIELNVKNIEKNSNLIAISNEYAMSSSNWRNDNNASVTNYNYNEKDYVILKALAEENNSEQYAWVIARNVKPSKQYTVSFNYTPVDPARNDIRVKIEYYNGEQWEIILNKNTKIPTTNTWSSQECFTYSFTAPDSAKEISISIGHGLGENCWVYISNFSLIEGAKVFPTEASLSVMKGEIQSKVSSGELSSLIRQDAESIKIAFNNIAKDIVTISENGIVMDGIIKCKGLADDTYAEFYPKITNNGDIKFEMWLAGNTAESDFMIYNRYYDEGGYLCVDPAASFGKGGATFFNNVTFNTSDYGQYAGKCYWQNGTYYPAEDSKNLIGLQTNKFNGVYTTWIGSEPGLASSSRLVVSGSELQFRSNFSHSFIQADESGYFRPTSTDVSNTWALGSPSYKFSALYANTVNNSSDIKLKENIQYLRRSNDINTMATQRLLNENVFYDISIQDLYEFVKNDLMLVKYRFKTSKEREYLQNDLFGFIAQDIKDTNVGSVLIEEFEDSTLSYDLSSYVSILAGALQESIIREEEHQEKTVELEKQVEDLKLKNLELEKRISELEQLILSKE